jgi:hypothetical protein
MRAACERPADAVNLTVQQHHTERDQHRDPPRRQYPAEASMSGSDLLVVAPWALFIAGVSLLILLAVTRHHSGDRRSGHRRSRSRRR